MCVLCDINFADVFSVCALGVCDLGGALGAALLYALYSGRKFYGVDIRALIGLGAGTAARLRADL